jgi:hypothetical protein
MRVSVVDSLPAGTNKIGSVDVATIPVTKGDWLSTIPNPSNLDVALSTRASESTLSGLSGKFPTSVALADNLANPTTTIIGAANLGFDGTYWRRIATDTSGRMKVALDSIPNPSNLDVALSTRASEATLSAIKNALASVGTDKIRASIVDSLPAGTNKIGSVDVASIPNPSNLDVALSTRASESTLSGLSGKFPSAVALGDSLSNPTTTIIGNALLGFDGTYWRRVRVDTSGRLAIQNEPNLDVALSTRASESTLSGIKTQTDKLTFDASNYLQVNVKATVNPSNLDVALSTRASESTLSGLSGKFPSAVALADNLSNPTTTIIGVANLGWDGSYWRRLATDTSSRLRTVVESVANPSNLDVALSTRASESTLSTLSGKFPSAVALGDSLSNPTTTIVGDALLGFDGTYWRRVRVDTSGRLAIQNEPNLDVALSTRASESTLSSFVGTPDSSPPSKGVVLLGYDGTYLRRLRVDSTGRLLLVLG